MDHRIESVHVIHKQQLSNTPPYLSGLGEDPENWRAPFSKVPKPLALQVIPLSNDCRWRSHEALPTRVLDADSAPYLLSQTGGELTSKDAG